MLSVITALEFFQHYFAKMGHRNTSCDPHLHQAIEQPMLPTPRVASAAGRLRPNAEIVQVQFSTQGTLPVMRLIESFAVLASLRHNLRVLYIALLCRSFECLKPASTTFHFAFSVPVESLLARFCCSHFWNPKEQAIPQMLYSPSL